LFSGLLPPTPRVGTQIYKKNQRTVYIARKFGENHRIFFSANPLPLPMNTQITSANVGTANRDVRPCDGGTNGL
jgi:hypothetical protein